MGALCLVLVLLFSTYGSLVLQSSKWERAGGFALTVFLMSYDSLCSVAPPHGTMGLSAVFDCGIS